MSTVMLNDVLAARDMRVQRQSEMIKKYHGYCSIIAKDQIKQIAKKEYCRVSDLIYEVMEDKI